MLSYSVALKESILIEYWDYWMNGYDATPPQSMGMASTLPAESQRDYGAELRAVIEEVTRKPCDPEQKRPIGFF